MPLPPSPTPPAQASLFSTLSGIMWLGNVDFAPHHDDNDSTIVRRTGVSHRLGSRVCPGVLVIFGVMYSLM